MSAMEKVAVNDEEGKDNVNAEEKAADEKLAGESSQTQMENTQQAVYEQAGILKVSIEDSAISESFPPETRATDTGIPQKVVHETAAKMSAENVPEVKAVSYNDNVPVEGTPSGTGGVDVEEAFGAERGASQAERREVADRAATEKTAPGNFVSGAISKNTIENIGIHTETGQSCNIYPSASSSRDSPNMLVKAGAAAPVETTEEDPLSSPPRVNSCACQSDTVSPQKDNCCSDVWCNGKIGKVDPFSPYVENASKDVSDDTRQIFEAMDSIVNIYHKFKEPPPFKRFVLVGLQSAGKSALVQRFIQFPMNIVTSGTGTRCPLSVKLSHDQEKAAPVCEIGNITYPKEQVAPHIMQHNRCLEQRNTFSSDELKLSVRSKDVPCMMFVDPPGVKLTQESSDLCKDEKGNDADMRAVIKRILQDIIEDPNAMMLVILEPDEIAKNAIIHFLDEVFRTGAQDRKSKWCNEDKALFVINKFDKIMNDEAFQTADNLNKLVKGYHEHGIVPFFVSTPPMKTESAHATSASESVYYQTQEHLLKLDGLERQSLLNYNEKLEASRFQDFGKEKIDFGVLDDTIRNRMGFPAVRSEMERHVFTSIKSKLPVVGANLRFKHQQLLGKQSVIEEQIKGRDPMRVRSDMDKWSSALRTRVLQYLDGVSLTALRNVRGCEMSLAEELKHEPMDGFASYHLNDYSPCEQEWRRWLQETRTKEDAAYYTKDRIFGGGQYLRALHFFKDQLVTAMPDPSSILHEEIISMMGALNNGIRQADWDRAIKAIVEYIMGTYVHPGVNWLVKHVGYVFSRLMKVGVEDLKSDPRHKKLYSCVMEGSKKVREFFDDERERMIKQLMEVASKKAHDALEPFYDTVLPDLAKSISPQADKQSFQNDFRCLVVMLQNLSGGALEGLLSQVDGFAQTNFGMLNIALRAVPRPPAAKLASGLLSMLLASDGKPEGHQEMDWDALSKEGTEKGIPFIASSKKPDDAPEGQTNAQGTFSSWIPNLSQSNTERKAHSSLKFGTERNNLSKQVEQSASEAKTSFTPQERRLFASNEDTHEIKQKAFKYIMDLMRVVSVLLEFYFNSYLLNEFKKQLQQPGGLADLSSDTICAMLSDADEEERLHAEEQDTKVQIKDVERAMQAVQDYASMKLAKTTSAIATGRNA